MTWLGKVLHSQRLWTGLSQASGAQLTPGDGWLLPVPVDARRAQQHSDEQRAARVRERSSRP
jgi:hypothetical protein